MINLAFGTRSFKDAGLRVFGSLAIAPLLCIGSLVTLYNVTGWTEKSSLIFSPTDIYALWGYIISVGVVGAVLAVMISTIAAAFALKLKRQAFVLLLAGSVLGSAIAAGYSFAGGSYFTILSSALALIILLIEVSRLLYNTVRPYVGLQRSQPTE